jgi:aminoglycoside phosphotransferase family enzyme
VKRAVRFPFMDYSTLERRHAACEREVAINAPNAPQIYVGVVPITRSDTGLRLGGEGRVVEWAVQMRRFDERSTLDVAADRGLRTSRDFG